MPSHKSRPAARSSAADDAAIEDSGQPTGGRSFWSGTISFGLVTIPVELYSATRSTRSSLRMLAPSGTPVSRRYFTGDGKAIDSALLARGYELTKGDFVVVSDDELDSLAPEQSRDIDLSRFVVRSAIPPLFFERAYILAPSGKSNVAYRLLAATLAHGDRAGIASFVMRGKQYVVAIVAEDGLLRAETLRFADELRTPKSIGLPEREEPSSAKVKAMRTAIEHDQKATVPDKELADTYWQRLEALVEKKQKNKQDIVSPAPVPESDDNVAEVIDLVAILKKSLGQKSAPEKKSAGEPQKSADRSPAKRSPAKRTATKKRAAKSVRKARVANRK